MSEIGGDHLQQVEQICEHVAGGKSQRAACKLVGVDESTFRLWRREDAEIDTQYTRAREDRAHLWAEQFMEIADNPQPGVKTTEKADGTVETVTGDMIEHRRLQIDARKWMMARILPKQYGEKLQQDINVKGEIALSEAISRARSRRDA